MSHAHSDAGAGHGSYGSYAIGFILSVILTAIPFAMVMSGQLSQSVNLIGMLVMGVVQIVVHLRGQRRQALNLARKADRASRIAAPPAPAQCR